MEYLLVSFHVNDVGVEGLTQAGLQSSDRGAELQLLLKDLNACEAFYLSTCNRTEFLFAFQHPIPLTIENVFKKASRVFRKRDEIIQHLLGVALSKDSVVFGESQILGQFKRAYEQALEWEVCGSDLSPLLNSIIREAKSIRSQIGLTQVHSSISTVAGAKIITSFEAPKPRILFIGSGETNNILAKYLKKRERFEFIWSSRGHQRAVQASVENGGEVLNWDLISKGMLPHCDVICVATHAREILVDDVGLLNANPKMICDLSVPANVCREVTSRLGILYFGMEELSEELAQSQIISQDLMNDLALLITASTEKIENELVFRDSKRILMQSFSKLNQVWESELNALLTGQLAELTPEQKTILTQWAQKLVKKSNHVQIESLKDNVRL